MISLLQLCRATAFWAVALPIFISSCAMAPGIQPHVNSLVVSQKLQQAAEALDNNPNAYGGNNELLYWLDRGMIEQCLGRYEDSINSFGKAQKKFDELYTKSISKMAGTWVFNDYAGPYRGEDYEYTLINIFQAVNYLMLGNVNEALVEARDMDSKLGLINSLYSGKNIYKDDAFGRFFMGILYEANGTSSDLNDAFIAYSRAYQIYEQDNGNFFDGAVPRLLKENLLTLAYFMGGDSYGQYGSALKGIPLVTLKEKKKKAEVYLIQYIGFSPVKVSTVVPVPFDARHITQVAFPKYVSRSTEIESSDFSAEKSDQLAYVQPTFIGQNIDGLAQRVLESHKAELLAKAVIRPAAKYVAERAISKEVQDKWGNGAAFGFNILSSLYNLTTERADIRSWQSLPAQIRIARLLLDPGDYEFYVQTYASGRHRLNKVSLGRATVEAGEKKFFLFRNYR